MFASRIVDLLPGLLMLLFWGSQAVGGLGVMTFLPTS